MQRRWMGPSALILGLLAASAAAADMFQARLGVVPVDPGNRAEIQGAGHAEAELDGSVLSVEGAFSDLVGPATSANLRMGRAVGVRGPVIHRLQITAERDGELTGSVALDAEQLAALRAGRLYIQVDSESAPDGNLWGWLLSE